MHLISLSASESSFKKVIFNKSGASFILAKQIAPEQEDKNKTYNGVGKSLLIALVNYCLGASTSNKITKSLQQILPEWHFILDIEVHNKSYEIIRYANRSNLITLNKEELSLGDFTKKLEALCFDVPNEIGFLSFRSLLPFFLRPSKQSYLSYDEPLKVSTPYHKQLYNAFLLGLDVHLAQTKRELKKDLDDTKKLQRNIQSDPILKKFFEGSEDSSLAIAELNEKIQKLGYDLKRFEVANDYYQVKKEADQIKSSIDKVHNQLVLKRMGIDNIDNSLKITPDVNRSDIESVYNESKLVFQLEVEKQLSDLETFYHDLAINRTRRLNQHRSAIIDEIRQLEEKVQVLKDKLDEHLQFLNAHQALDVFTKMTNLLSSLQQQREKLQGYEKLQHDYEQKKTSLAKDMLLETEKTTSYLDKIKDKNDSIMDSFRALVKQFYPEALAGVTIHPNSGKNQIRYDIEAKIQSDSSDGINSVKLFCYDLILLTQENNHSMQFMFHDSRLFSDIDEAHCNVLFNIVENAFPQEGNLQYIASINQNQLHSLSQEARAFVEGHVVQTLTDDSDDGKLLGITVELEYD